MERIRREEFVPEAVLHLTYEDIALPIGEGQTISQPYIVALMVGALKLQRGDRVLEVGTGSGYQAAILAELCREVVSVERIPIAGGDGPPAPGGGWMLQCSRPGSELDTGASR